MSLLSLARRNSLAGLILCTLALSVSAQRAPDDCSWQNGSKLRRAVKLRTTADGKSYTDYHNGQPLTLGEWFSLTCSFDARVPQTIPEASPIPELETVRVTLRGYLVGARFERDEDHDIQAELSASPQWNADHVLIEMPAGKEYCAARHALWNVLRQDGCRGDECLMRKPVEVLITGYVLLGGAPQGTTDYCHVTSSRGLRRQGQSSRVRGAWRLQPVLSVKVVAPAQTPLQPRPHAHSIRRFRD